MKRLNSMEFRGKQQETEIKYDKRILKIILISAVLFTVAIFVGLLPAFFIIKDMPSQMNTPLMDFIFLIAVFSVFPTVALWIKYIDGRLYLRMLEKAGFEVPADRRIYGNSLHNLPITKEINTETEGRNRSCVILSGICMAVSVVFFLTTLNYFLMWRRVTDIGMFVIFLAGLAILWLVGAGIYYKRSDNGKYRNFYVLDSRKLRQTFFNGAITILLSGVISAVLSSLPFSMTRYVARTMELQDKENIESMLSNINNFYKENEGCYQEKWEVSHRRLAEGVNFLTADWDEDLFTAFIMENNEIDEMNKLEAKFRMKGKTLWIQVDDTGAKAEYSYIWEYGRIKTVTITAR